MGGRSAKVKGDSFERQIVEMLKDGGVDAHRIPLSGAVAAYPGDVKFQCQGEWIVGECKRRKSGFKTLYNWLGTNKVLFFRDDKCEAMVMLRVTDYRKLAVLV